MIHKKTESGKRSALRIFFNPDSTLKQVDYRGIDVLNDPAFLRLQGSHYAKFRYAIFELGRRGILRPDDLEDLIKQIKKVQEEEKK